MTEVYTYSFWRGYGRECRAAQKEKLSYKANGREIEIIIGLLVDSDTAPNPFFQHKPTKCVSTCSHPLFAQDADSLIVTFRRR